MNSNWPHIHSAPEAAAAAEAALRFAAACQQCGAPAPCTCACPPGVDIAAVMAWVGRSGCAGFSLKRWMAALEHAADAGVADQICSAYN